MHSHKILFSDKEKRVKYKHYHKRRFHNSVMTKFVCETCERNFQRRENLDYHKTHNACKQRDYKCRFCDAGFTSAANMYRHMKYNCKIRKQNEDEKTKIYERLLKLEEDNKRLAQLEEDNKKLKHKVQLLEKKNTNNPGTTNTNTNSNGNTNANANTTTSTNTKSINNVKTVKTINSNNNNINNTNNGTVINNHFTLVGYGKEDLSKLDKKEMLKILQNGYNSTIRLTQAVHFNPKYPEYHNIYISNMKNKYAMMYDGATWGLTIKDDLIDRIYDDKKNYIEENLEDFIDSLSESRKKALERWLATNDDDIKIKNIKEQIKLLLYNNRKLAMDVQLKDNTQIKKNPQIKTDVNIINDDNSNVSIRKKRKIKRITKDIDT
jgi:hypothetical protein